MILTSAPFNILFVTVSEISGWNSHQMTQRLPCSVQWEAPCGSSVGATAGTPGTRSMSFLQSYAYPCCSKLYDNLTKRKKNYAARSPGIHLWSSELCSFNLLYVSNDPWQLLGVIKESGCFVMVINRPTLCPVNNTYHKKTSICFNLECLVRTT